MEFENSDLMIRGFRKAIDQAVADGCFSSKDRMSGFPVCCCDDACDLLGMYLKACNIFTRQVVGTYRGNNSENVLSHAWLLTDEGTIIDITGDQFRNKKELLNYNKPVYVGKEDPFHQKFQERRIVENFDFVNEGTIGAKRLLDDYRIINVFEEIEYADLRKVDLCAESIGNNAAEIAFYAASGDVCHTVDLIAFEKVSDGLVVGRVGLHYLLDESHAVDLVHLDLGLLFHEEPDQ